MDKPQKIVVARYRFIGDTLLTIPFLRALRKRHPQAEIHLLVGEDAYALMQDCPYIDRAIAFEPRKQGLWQSIRRIRAERYELAYLLKRSFSSAMIMAVAGIPQRIGFDCDGRGWLLTRRVPYRQYEQHEAQCFLDLLPKEDAMPDDLRLETWGLEAYRAKMASFVHLGEGPRVVLHATSTNVAKCWPLSHFQALAERLVSEHQARLYFLGTAPEAARYQTLIEGLSPQAQAAVSNLCGQTTLVESLALLQQMTLVVANDSGMIHMAAAAGAPVIALFGPMDPQQWRPLAEKATILTHPALTCRPCRMKITCSHQYPCLVEITPQTVLNACKPYLIS